MPSSSNFGAAANDYATFRKGFPEELFRRLAALGIGTSGETLVDLGTGTGALAREFASRGCRVTAIDPDARMLEQAGKLAEAAGLKIEFKVGRAEAIPVPDASCDIVTAGQCWHWFDGQAAAREMARVVRPGGRVVIAHFDWLPLEGSVVAETERLILKHNPTWRFGGGNGFHPYSLPPLAAAGFAGLETFSFDVDMPYTHEGWRGRIRASVGVGASLPPDGVEAFDREHAKVLAECFPTDVLQTPHRVFCVIGSKRAQAMGMA